jgi:hypothetical protein
VPLGGGSAVRAGLVYRCVGISACTELLEGLPLDEEQRRRSAGRGFPVQPSLQVRCLGAACARRACSAAGCRALTHRSLCRAQLAGQQHIYCCGDCVDMPYEKTAFLAECMANMVCDNIKRQDKGRPLLSFPAGAVAGAATPPAVASVSLGKWCGVMQFNGLVVGGLPAVLVKLMIEQSIMRVARGSRLWLWFWTVNEWFTVLAGRFLFR